MTWVAAVSAGLLIITLCLLVILFWALAWAFPVVEEELARAESPDGKYVALVRSRDVNATTTTSLHVFLDYVDDAEPNDENRIFVLLNFFPLELKWLDAATLLISSSEPVPRKQVFVQVLNSQGIEVRYSETLLSDTTAPAIQL